MTRLITALILGAGLFLQAAPVLAEGAPAQSDCSEEFSCACNGVSLSAIQSQLQTVTSIASASAICQNACADAGEEGNWDLACGGDQVNQGKIVQDSATSDTVEERTVPQLAVPIPGLVFTPAVAVDGQISSNYIGQYVKVLYSLAIVIGSIGVILTVMIAGLRWMVARGNSSAVGDAKESMGKAFIALFILLGVISLVELVDPTLVAMQPLKLTVIENRPMDLHMDGEGEAIIRTDLSTSDLVPISGEHIIVQTTDNRIHKETLAALQEAAKQLSAATRKDILIVSAFRDPAKQADLFYTNCIRTGGVCSVPTCNPVGSSLVKKEGEKFVLTGELAGETDKATIVNTMAQNANIGNCPHTSSVAVDVYCVGSRRAALNVSCTNLLTEAMIDNGFCRIGSEPWHFELASKHVSSDCSTGNNSTDYRRKGKSYSTAGCITWDYMSNTCTK